MEFSEIPVIGIFFKKKEQPAAPATGLPPNPTTVVESPVTQAAKAGSISVGVTPTLNVRTSEMVAADRENLAAEQIKAGGRP
ncbi:MAG: hypothetical protein Q7S31_02600 [bacterium]|nr:hypothetical protein [bacterium]